MNGLSDDELAVITDLARPLPPDQRSPFLAAVVAEASQHPEIGPGLIARIARDLRRRYTPPSTDNSGSAPATPPSAGRGPRAP